jgi:hypothetical protein
MSYDIKGLDKRALLKELWQRQKPVLFFRYNPHMALKWDDEEIDEALTDSIDYYRGRCIKMDLRGDTLKTNGYYEQDAGAGTIAAAIAAIRAAGAAAASSTTAKK